MSSTSKTANLRLNRWEGTDPVDFADLNEDNRIIDENIGRRKLIDITAEETGTLQLDFSGIELDKFAEFIFLSNVKNRNIGMQINGYTEKKYIRLDYYGNIQNSESITLPPHPIHLCIQSSKYVVGTEMYYNYYELGRGLAPNLQTVDMLNVSKGERFTVWGVIV